MTNSMHIYKILDNQEWENKNLEKIDLALAWRFKTQATGFRLSKQNIQFDGKVHRRPPISLVLLAGIGLLNAYFKNPV